MSCQPQNRTQQSVAANYKIFNKAYHNDILVLIYSSAVRLLFQVRLGSPRVYTDENISLVEKH